MSVPSFLRSTRGSGTTTENLFVVEGVVDHENHASDVLWFPPKAEMGAVLFFIPGNPGFIRFYTEFLSCIHSSFSNLAVITQAHVGHTHLVESSEDHASLDFQVHNALSLYDLLRREYPTLPLFLGGHSVGTWVALQVAKIRNDIRALLLLCPTLSNIASTPNGRRLSWLFYPPVPRMLGYLVQGMRLLPVPRILSVLFHHWPPHQRQVLYSIVTSPSAVYCCLTMAHHEMNVIQVADAATLTSHAARLHLLFSFKDNWVAEEERSILAIVDSLIPAEQLARLDITHDFCIGHSLRTAEQCISWLRPLGVS